MNKFANEFDRLLDLAGLVCDEIATQEDLIELNALMHADKASCGRYLDYCRVHGGLRLESRARHVARRAYVQINTDAGGSVSGGLDVASTETTSSPVIAFSSDAFRNTFAYFSSGWPAAYLIAAVIMGIGMVIGALTHVSHPGESVGHSTMTAMNRSASPPQELFVGRITAMVGCKLADQSKPPSRRVVMGNNYSIASGLLEITYDTGAKVILQGPCTYQVDSTSGGYLSIGKLTARIGERGEGREEREGARSKVQGSRQENLQTFKSQNPEIPKSHNPLLTTNHYPLFTIKTPTATITDLGTEFGVEVDKAGGTTSHVFQGSVRVQTVAADGKTIHEARILRENESVRVERRDAASPAVIVHTSSPSPLHSFVRELPRKTTPPKLTHLWTFDMTGADVIGGSEYDLTFLGSAACDANESRIGAGSLSGLVGAEDYATVRTYFPPDDLFTISAWIKTNSDGYNHAVFAWGQRDGNRLSRQFRLGEEPYPGQLIYGQSGPGETWHAVRTGEFQINDGVWHHIAVVREKHKATLYIDGATQHEWTSYLLGGEPPTGEVTIGGMTFQPYTFGGYVDDLGYWATALNNTQILAIFRLGSHPKLRYGQKDVAMLFQIHSEGRGEIACGERLWTVRSHLPERTPGELIEQEDDAFTLYFSSTAGLCSSANGDAKNPDSKGAPMTP